MAEPTTSRLDDYLDVFVAPSKLFERRSDGKFGQALLILVVLTTVLFLVTRTAMAPIWDAEITRSMAKSSSSMTPEQLEAAKKFGAVFGGIFVIVGLPITVLLLGAGIWLAARLVGKSLSYAQGATIAAFGYFPRLVEAVVGAVQALLMDESRLNSRYAVSLGVGRFLDPVTANPYLLAMVGRVDVFTIWITMLVAVGLKVMAKASTAQAVAGSVTVWLIGALPMLYQATRM